MLGGRVLLLQQKDPVAGADGAVALAVNEERRDVFNARLFGWFALAAGADDLHLRQVLEVLPHARGNERLAQGDLLGAEAVRALAGNFAADVVNRLGRGAAAVGAPCWCRTVEDLVSRPSEAVPLRERRGA